MRAGLPADHWRVFLEGVDVCGGCSATVELVLAFRARASSDLIISRHLAGKERVLSLHYDSTTT
jgi:hypothetical protein